MKLKNLLLTGVFVLGGLIYNPNNEPEDKKNTSDSFTPVTYLIKFKDNFNLDYNLERGVPYYSELKKSRSYQGWNETRKNCGLKEIEDVLRVQIIPSR